MDDESNDYRTAMFYRFKRNQFRFKMILKGNCQGNILNGMQDSPSRIHNSSVDIDKLNKGKMKSFHRSQKNRVFTRGTRRWT